MVQDVTQTVFMQNIYVKKWKPRKEMPNFDSFATVMSKRVQQLRYLN